MERKNITEIVTKYIKNAGANERYSSFDYCYNYFTTTENFTLDMEKSCLELGFYLASWGMFRGKSILLQKSIKYYENIIDYLSTLDKSYWRIDIDDYFEDQNVLKIFEIHNKLSELTEGTDTLITKIMLGVFGCIPAFDRYFMKTFDIDGFTFDAIEKIKIFYSDNRKIINELSQNTFTKDFISGKDTKINYTKAKIIDMYGFTLGLLEEEKNNHSEIRHGT